MHLYSCNTGPWVIILLHLLVKHFSGKRNEHAIKMFTFGRYFALTEMYMVVAMVMNKFDLKLTTEVPQAVSGGLHGK